MQPYVNLKRKSGWYREVPKENTSFWEVINSETIGEFTVVKIVFTRVSYPKQLSKILIFHDTLKNITSWNTKDLDFSLTKQNEKSPKAIFGSSDVDWELAIHCAKKLQELRDNQIRADWGMCS